MEAGKGEKTGEEVAKPVSIEPEKEQDVAKDASIEPKEAQATSSAQETLQETKDVAPEREPGFKDFLRIFSYATKWDILLMLGAAFASIGAGVTMPLMNVVFGNLVGNFNAYGGAAKTQAQAQADFDALVNRQSLYMLALFIARFGLNYINKV